MPGVPRPNAGGQAACHHGAWLSRSARSGAERPSCVSGGRTGLLLTEQPLVKRGGWPDQRGKRGAPGRRLFPRCCGCWPPGWLIVAANFRAGFCHNAGAISSARRGRKCLTACWGEFSVTCRIHRNGSALRLGTSAFLRLVGIKRDPVAMIIRQIARPQAPLRPAAWRCAGRKGGHTAM